MIVLACGERQHRCDVVRLQVGVVGEDLLVGRTRRQEVENVLHANAQATNAGAPTAHLWIDGNSIDCAHLGQFADCRCRPFYRVRRLTQDGRTLAAIARVRICANSVVAGVRVRTHLHNIRPQDTRQFASAQQITQLEGLAVAIP